ncbi:hypothetical protein MesoLj131b_05480 [Mesorhizobium sp. 131-2-5]|nr:hypothetical protein MesoLj131b_05480 [Mesorhizobium sp. 131-2-5]
MARMLRSDRKAGSSSQKKAISKAMAASTPTSPTAIKPISRRRNDRASLGAALTSAALFIPTSLAATVAALAAGPMRPRRSWRAPLGH